ncbi:hypothetical protein HanRHA438_Chr02g0079641 [Helianthus annuus]|uniref:Uncharacterized protein n=1 Tax=Helianthus annuus TaxID=4232 RepID=A0A251TC98_HELAN|nr:hypothetical protein HanHA300_Chr11g0417351 [Helianthus annuus]KAJ0518786.1 hypothetical protein HanHA89_Chr11g0441341 [Helianthus annuus]KAJ0528185.1 hypothetical protein HanHA300_Chr09g0342391 [Helianthus annuus]KAJ0539551.1 hypothetical protein HanHA300_Chr08g0287641 [Helianthus annuus]KAJ0544609.1 hypothetical protein HanHA89_Chr09g0363551 [Helianthus annuus]
MGWFISRLLNRRHVSSLPVCRRPTTHYQRTAATQPSGDGNWDSCEVSAFCLPNDDGGLLLGMATPVATIAPLSRLKDDHDLFVSEL